MKRNIAVLIGIVILSFVAYKVFGLYFSPKEPTTTVKAAIPTSVTTKRLPARPSQTSQNATQAATTRQAPAPAPTQQGPVAIDSRSLAQLETSMRTQIDQQIQANQREMLKLGNNIDSLKASISQLSAKLSEVNTELDKISEQVEKKREPAPITIPDVKRKPRKPMPRARRAPSGETMFIQALIPGRAWLRTESGKSLTVGLGKSIPGYGVVRRIDPNLGIVYTSSGRTIKYHPTEK